MVSSCIHALAIYTNIVNSSTLFVLSAMIIGFNHNFQCVNESDAPRGAGFFGILINVMTLRESEREHWMLYRLLSNATARVVSFEYFQDLNFDARFGGEQTDPIEQMDFLAPGETVIRPLRTEIRNDFVLEDEECYSIQISPIDIPGLREIFMCDYKNSFLCIHTICIKDDDGKVLKV